MKINLMLNFTCAFVLPNVSVCTYTCSYDGNTKKKKKVCMYVCMYVHPRGALMGGLLELSFLSSTRSITTTVSEYRYGWPPERYLPSFCGSNLGKAEDTVKVRSKWRPTAIIYLTTRAVIAEQRARKTCFHKNVAEDDVSTGHSPRMRLAREAIAKRYFADENKLDAELYVCLCPP